MVPKPVPHNSDGTKSFRAVLFRMVQKQQFVCVELETSFRAVLFRMVPKQRNKAKADKFSFRAVLFRMVPKLGAKR